MVPARASAGSPSSIRARAAALLQGHDRQRVLARRAHAGEPLLGEQSVRGRPERLFGDARPGADGDRALDLRAVVVDSDGEGVGEEVEQGLERSGGPRATSLGSCPNAPRGHGLAF